MSMYKNYFPPTKQYTYLNTPASGLLSEPVMEWRKKHDLDFFVQGSLLKIKEGEILQEVREKVGMLFHCAANRVGLTPNFSYGFNTLVARMSSTKKVLLLEGDYPSITWPFSTGGFELSYVVISAVLEEEVEAAFAKAQPDIFAFSLVQWLNGVKIDLEFLKKLKTNYPETLFIADGTQYLGTELFDFDNAAVDIVGGSTYKWMNGGYGNAIFMFKEGVAKRLAPETGGFGSLQGEYKAFEGSFLGSFEPGHLDSLNFGSLGAAIDLIHNIGMPAIDKAIKELALLAQRAFQERGLLEPMVSAREEHSNIFNLKGDDALYKRLRKKGILCAQRGTGIRVGFHYFNTQEDLKVLLEALDAEV